MKEVVIQFGQGDAVGYSVTLFERNGGAMNALAGPGTMALTNTEITALENLLPGNTPPAQLQQQGLALYTKLQAALGQPLDDALNGATARFYLDLPPGDLYRIPWEILSWNQPAPVGVALTWVRQVHHLCRVFKPAWSDEAPRPAGPLRVLIVIGSAEKDNDVDASEEETEIRRLVHPGQRTIDIESIPRPSKADLYATIGTFRPHVLHFIGHGTSNPASLRIEPWDWTAGDVGGDVGGINLDSWVPRLVFLNACRTANAGSSAAPMALTFVSRNVKAAVAMQGNIKGAAAGLIAGAFYQGVAAGEPIVDALSKARALISQKYDARQAALPALTMLCPATSALPAFRCLGEDYKTRLTACDLLPTLNVFVNQTQPRRDLAAAFWPILQSDSAHGVVLLHGDSGFGKSVLSAWLLDLSLRSGHHVRYVKVAPDTRPINELEILQAIWGGVAPGISPLSDPLPITATSVAKLLPAANDIGVYTVFRQALAEAAAERPVTIVLDDFRQRMPHGSFWVLWEHLIVPIAKRQVPNVLLLLSLREDDYTFYGIDEQLKVRPELRVPVASIQLQPMTAQEFLKQLDEYLYFRSEDFRTIRQRFLALIADGVPNDPEPLSVAQFEKRAMELAGILRKPLAPLRSLKQ